MVSFYQAPAQQSTGADQRAGPVRPAGRANCRWGGGGRTARLGSVAMSDLPPPLTLDVPAELDGARLDRALAVLVDGWSRSQLKRLVLAGSVHLDGELCERPGAQVRPGNELHVVFPQRPGPMEGAGGTGDVVVLYEDREIVVVDKSAGLVVHRNERHVAGTVADLMQARYGPLPDLYGGTRPGIVHRLDRETSGVMIIGRTEEALINLQEQFRKRRVEKTYVAICHGEPRFDSDWVKTPIGTDPQRPERMAVVPEGEGRPSETFYSVLTRFRGFTHMECKPKTGRTHQIRVHMTSIGLPLVADHTYRHQGTLAVPLPDEAPDPKRQCLHARRISFTHPGSGEPMVCEAPLPQDMADLLAYLKREYPPTA